jgi:hypothetical protein
MTRARDVANIDGLLTTTGDTYYASAAGTPARRAIGTTGQVLTVSGGLPTWATPATASSGMTLINRTTFSSVATTTTSFDSVFSSTYKTYLISIENLFGSTTGSDLYFQLRYAGPTTQAATYLWRTNNSTINTGTSAVEYADNVSQIQLTSDTGSSAERFSGQYYLTNAETTARTSITGLGITGRTAITYEASGY